MMTLAQLFLNTLRPTALYALIGLGFVIVYLATGGISFAQGEFVALGGLFCAWLIAAGLPLVVSVGLTLIASIIAGWLFDFLLIRPLARRRSGGAGNGSGAAVIVRMVIITIGASVLLRQTALHLFGPDELTMPTFFKQQVLVLGGGAGGNAEGLRVETQTLVLLAVFAVVMLAFMLLYNHSRFGKSMRANEQSPEGAVLMGVRPERVVNRAFVLSAFLGALCGVLVTPLIQMAYGTGAGLGVKGFTVAILGGLSNPLGVVLGGFLLGLIETITASYFNPLYKDAVALAVLILMLIMRPTGLLGSREKKKL